MKKFLSVILMTVFIVSFSGCNEVNNKSNSKIQIVATIYPLYDFARSIAGDRADITLLLPCGADAHSYEPTVQDVVAVQESSLFIMLGKDAEPWAEGVAENLAENKVVSAMDCVNLNEHHYEGHSFFEYDQHIWTSLRNSEKIVTAVAESLAEIDNVNEEYYKKNAEEYIKKLEYLDKKFTELTKNAEKKLVFADRFPFEYFTEDYSLQYYAAFPGCSEESEPSAASVTELINIIKKENIDVVFYTETSNGKLPDMICNDTGAEKALLHSCHTVTREELDSGKTYIELMEENYNTLEYYLKKQLQKN